MVNEKIVIVFDILLLKKTFLNNSLFCFCFITLIVFGFYCYGIARIIIISRNNCGALVTSFIIDAFRSAGLIVYQSRTSLPTIKFDNTGGGLRENFNFYDIINDCYQLLYATPASSPTLQSTIVLNEIGITISRINVVKGVFGVDCSESMIDDEICNDMFDFYFFIFFREMFFLSFL